MSTSGLLHSPGALVVSSPFWTALLRQRIRTRGQSLVPETECLPNAQSSVQRLDERVFDLFSADGRRGSNPIRVSGQDNRFVRECEQSVVNRILQDFERATG